jgi:hypothetical protein
MLFSHMLILVRVSREVLCAEVARILHFEVFVFAVFV